MGLQVYQVRTNENDRDKVEVQDLTEDQRQTLSFVEHFFNRGLELRRVHEINWFRNMAFFMGHHYLRWDNARSVFYEPMCPSWRVRYKDNRIKPTCLHIVAKLTKNRPQMVVVPSKTDDESLHTATVGKKIIQHTHQLNHGDILNQDVFFMSYLYGSSYKDAFWDNDAGEPIVTFEKKDGSIEMLMTGDIGEEALSPFQIVWEEGATDINKCFRIGKLVNKSLDYIRRTYPDTGKYVTAETKSGNTSMESMMNSILDRSLRGRSRISEEKSANSESQDQNGYATIRELREMPSGKYPKGRIVRICNGILLSEEELPYEFMWKYRCNGITQYDFVRLTERWTGETPLNDLIPLQIKLNRTESAIQEIENQMAKPKWLAHHQHKLSRNAIDNETGEVIIVKGDPGLWEPHPIRGTEIPMSLFTSLENDSIGWREVSMLHETSKGQKIPGVTAGTAMRFLEEQDQTVYQPVLTRFEVCEEQHARNVLMLAKERYLEPRLLQILGDNKQIETFDFESNEDIPTTVRVIPGSSYPASLAAKQEAIFAAVSNGLFGDPNLIPDELRMKILSSIEFNDVDMIYEQLTVDEREARKEHSKWKKGIVEPPNIFDNHDVMIPRHDLFRKSDNYRKIKRQAPQVAQMIDQHVAMHMEMSPRMQQAQRENEMLEQDRRNANMGLAIDNVLKESEFKGKEAERKVTLYKMLTEGEISNQQTVKE